MEHVNIAIKRFGVAGLIFFMWMMSNKDNKEQLRQQACDYKEIIKAQNEDKTRNFKILHEMLDKMSLSNERLGNIEIKLQNIKENIKEGR